MAFWPVGTEEEREPERGPPDRGKKP